jgi:hypothetical protein
MMCHMLINLTLPPYRHHHISAHMSGTASPDVWDCFLPAKKAGQSKSAVPLRVAIPPVRLPQVALLVHSVSSGAAECGGGAGI